LALPFNFVFLSAWGSRDHSLDWLSPAVTAIETFYFSAAFGIFLLRIFCLVAIDIRFDGIHLIMPQGKKPPLRVAADRIRWVDVVIRKQRGLHVHPDRPLSQLFSLAPSVSLEIYFDEGRVRQFSVHEKEHLDWLCAALRELLELPDDPPASTPDVVADETHLYGRPRVALVTAGFVLSTIFLSLAARDVIPGLLSLKWAQVSGVVTHARYEERVSKSRDLAEITYSYTVLGQTYTSSRVGFGRDEEQKTLRDIIDSHPQGSSVRVYYDPNDPKQAVLINGFGIIGWLMLVPGVLLLLLCVPVALRGSTAREAALLKKFRNPSPG